ncbi:MAG: hypothetical protein LBC22_05445, partial [Endomicrobium sp.]|nr:hypothetical protein [Endomicrobium sp.]
MDVAYEYIVAYKGDGTFYMDENANIYLLNDTDRVYQARKESGSRSPTSGQYKGAAPERENWTHGKIIETETGYIIFGAGSRISAKKTSRGWEANAIGIGTEAMAGSTLRISANDPKGVAATIFLDIKEGFMVYAGNYWVPSDGFVWKFNESVTDEQIEQFIKNTITTQLGANAEGIEEIELIGSEGQYRNKTMLGAPFSTAAIFKSMGISAKIHTKGGFTYDATKSDGDIYKLTIETATVLELKVKDDDLVIVATEDIRVNATITEGDWALDTGGTTLTETIKKGQVFSFGTMLNNTGRQIVNTREIEIITG